MQEEWVRDRSKHVFGNRYMLEVCAALSGVDDRATLTSLLSDSGLSPSVYFGPLRRLSRVGLLEFDARAGDDRRERWFRPTPSALWTAARELSGQATR